MSRPRYHLAAALGLALVLQVPVAAADDCAAGFQDGWARLPPVEMPVLGGFGTLHNPCDSEMVLTGASSPDFEDVQVHETRLDDGMMRMREVGSLAIPAGGSVALAPGALHLMLMRPVRALVAGDEVELGFEFADGTTVSARLEVR
ncbi:copper chaperone PCu(A)C [Lysobacter sp. GX 14042]|uniref:copper chaperone PCu(A)C n=1 Tax=Lysobacter sp. GX 14042 TaxID=2907155 RepID=UPI001F23F31E|nr:copper chaperone PCu(A)C [Lysobacter sp. GX 14042]MCE7033221.1 copper chaperone PCu(A)C [Lysobacter sp. GX 14042]